MRGRYLAIWANEERQAWIMNEDAWRRLGVARRTSRTRMHLTKRAGATPTGKMWQHCDGN